MIIEIIPINQKETEALLTLILALTEGLLYKIKSLFSSILIRLYLLTISLSKLFKLYKLGKIIIFETRKGSNLQLGFISGTRALDVALSERLAKHTPTFDKSE
jgi:hypothetical protein